MPAIAPLESEEEDDSSSKTGKFVVLSSLAGPESLKLHARTLCASIQFVFEAENPTYMLLDT